MPVIGLSKGLKPLKKKVEGEEESAGRQTETKVRPLLLGLALTLALGSNGLST